MVLSMLKASIRQLYIGLVYLIQLQLLETTATCSRGFSCLNSIVLAQNFVASRELFVLKKIHPRLPIIESL